MSLKAEDVLRLRTLDGLLARHHGTTVLEKSGLDVARLEALVAEVHGMATAAGLRIEVLATPDMAHRDYRTTTLRVTRGNLCVLSRTLR